MNIGDKIRTARLAKGMTQSELGDILGVKDSAIAKYESGRVVNIKRSTLKKISDVLGIPPIELIVDGLEEKPTEHDGLSDSKRKLIDFVHAIPDDKAELILRVAKSILADGE